MCIFLVSTEHKEFPFILLDNRDEYFDRPTAPAHWWQESPQIYGPQDLQREEHGTWIGVTRGGRVAVLVNYFEENMTRCKLSRGLLPMQFLQSELSPKEWVSDVRMKHKDELKQCGKFTLLAAKIKRDNTKGVSTEIEYLTNELVQLPDARTYHTLALSNGPMNDTDWSKTRAVLHLANPLFQISDPSAFAKEALSLLSTKFDPPPQTKWDLRNHIFVPEITNEKEGSYGTRTQTIIACDKNGVLYYTEFDVVTGTMSHEKIELEIN